MKKRIVSLLLSICLLLSTTVLFSSCGKKTVEFGEGYSVIYADDISVSLANDVRAFADTLEKKTDSDIDLEKVKVDAELEEENDLEILIGNTNRPETEKALKKIKDHGFIITVYGSKVVIAGTTNFLTNLALDFFTDTYLSGEETVASLTIEKTEVEEVEMLDFTNKWAFIHSPYLDGERDYINQQITELKSLLADFSDVRGTAMRMLADTDTTASQEILVGIVDREESKAFMSGMDANNYGIGAKNGKLLVSAKNDGMIAKAFACFTDALRDSVCLVGEEKLILLPADFALIYTDTSKSSLVTDFPRPEGLELSGTIDVHDGMEYYYEGDGVTADAYSAYCNTLTAAGYTVYTESSAENSIFRTYVNREKNITLYVAYNDFKHAASEETKHQKAIRIVASSLDSVNLLEEDLLTQDLSYEKMQNSSITAIKLHYTDGNWGNLYVITLEDGSFILLDGGASNTIDRDRIYAVLCDLYARGNHATDVPTKEDPIRIAAWYLSHGHGDHYGSMASFVKQYCANYDKFCVTVDRLIANFASDEEYFNSESGRETTGVGSYNSTMRDKFAQYSAYVSDAPGEEPGFKYYKVHTGQKFWLANVELNVMYTHEDQYPRRIHVYNNTSTVIRMSLYHTNDATVSAESETTMIWLGDSHTNASAWMRATYGEALQSDMVQVAHHGYSGCEWALYQLVAPTCVWWPTDQNTYKKYHNAKATGSGLVDYNINYKLQSVQYMIVSDVCNYTVTIAENGADYTIGGSTGVFSAGDGLPVSYGNVNAYASASLPNTCFLKSIYNDN